MSRQESSSPASGDKLCSGTSFKKARGTFLSLHASATKNDTERNRAVMSKMGPESHPTPDEQMAQPLFRCGIFVSVVMADSHKYELADTNHEVNGKDKEKNKLKSPVHRWELCQDLWPKEIAYQDRVSSIYHSFVFGNMVGNGES
jgi:hypothetical protein